MTLRDDELCVAVAERLIRDSLAYAMPREQFGKPVAEFQLVQAMLADSRAECDTARPRISGHADGNGVVWTIKGSDPFI